MTTKRGMRKVGKLSPHGRRLGRPSKNPRPQPERQDGCESRHEVDAAWRQFHGNHGLPEPIFDHIVGTWVRPAGPPYRPLPKVVRGRGRPAIGTKTLDIVQATLGKNKRGYAAAVAQAEADAKSEGNSNRAERRAYLTVKGAKRKMRHTRAVIKAAQQKNAE